MTFQASHVLLCAFFKVETIRQSSPGGGFVKKEGNMWYEAGDHLARYFTNLVIVVLVGLGFF